jgi:hypothetical protein
METQIRTDLVKVSTYATNKKKSTTWVYDQIKDKKVQLVIIDGVKFVKIPV